MTDILKILDFINTHYCNNKNKSLLTEQLNLFLTDGYNFLTKETLIQFLENRYKNWSTYNSRMRRWRAILNFLEKRKFITNNFYKELDLKRCPVGEIAPVHQNKYISIEQLRLILDRLKKLNYRHYLIIKVLLESGARVREVIYAEKKFFKKDKIYIPITKTQVPRWIFLSETTGRELEEFMNSHCSDTIFNCGYDFLRANWKKVTKDLIHEETGKPITIHHLRHTFASNLVDKLAPLEIMQLLGHQDFRTTRGYIHANYTNLEKRYKAVTNCQLRI